MVFRIDRIGSFSVIAAIGLLAACGKTPSSSNATSLNATSLDPSIWRLGTSYNGVASTFDRIRVNSVHQAGYRGEGVRIHLQDVDPVNYSRKELQHTVLPGHRVRAGINGHATAMALVAAGARNSKGEVGIAPQVKLVENDDNYDAMPIVSNSILGTNLITCQYQIPDGGIRPGVYLNPPAEADGIYVIIAGNSGPTTPTNMQWGIPDDYYPVHGNIIVTVAVNESNQITSTSSRCGRTHRFCIAVPSPGPTSPTAPLVSGAIALLVEAVPGRPFREYVEAILNAATPLSSPSDFTGVGLLNVEAALTYLREHVPATTH